MTDFWLFIIAGTLLLGSAAMTELLNSVIKLAAILVGAFLLIWLATNSWPFVTDLLRSVFPWVAISLFFAVSVYVTLSVSGFVRATCHLFRNSTFDDLAPVAAAAMVLGAIVVVWVTA